VRHARAWEEVLPPDASADGGYSVLWVEFVSPSFLDETLIRLAQEEPSLASRVLIRGLSDFSAKRLRVALDRRGLDWTLTARPAGDYALEG